MLAYQFVNYNFNTKIEHIKKYAENNAIICFDFEDSIEYSEKIKYREYFKYIKQNILTIFPQIRIGVRINNEIHETNKDLIALKNYNINSVILPKIESLEEIIKFEKLLAEYNISYDEIIPTIENKNGILNLESMIQIPNHKIKRYGFGHCDYNLNINSFPFFHQNSIEYWKWIKHLHSVLSPKKISILNSPYLELNNYSFFQSMMHFLFNIFGNEVAQTTLTSEQSKIINQFSNENGNCSFDKLIKHRLNLAVPLMHGEQIVESFNYNKKNKRFSILDNYNLLISPQEYLAAKNYIKQKRKQNINLTFVGGCFPVQNDILFEDLFHQKLKREIENKYKVELNLNIIRYECFNSCLKKIKNYQKNNHIDFLVFHLRPEPFLRIVKILYKHLNINKELKYSVNIPLLRSLNIENFNILKYEKSIVFSSTNNQSILHKVFINLNYLAGIILGNFNFAINKYFELTNIVVDFCKTNEIDPIILGIGNRNNSSFEPLLCKRINKFFKLRFENQNISYIETISIRSRIKDEYYRDNGIHASEKYHGVIAKKLFAVLEDKLKIATNKQIYPTASLNSGLVCKQKV